MIQHTVAFTLIHPAGSDEEADFLSTGREILTSVPGVRGFVVNRQVSAKSDYTFQFSMSFEDQEAYDAYDAHPAHRGFVESRWVTEVSAFEELDFVAL